MKMKYETDRLVLQVLTDAAADRVLKFYQNNREVFEPYEVERSKNFYTEQYHKTLLQCEYNLAIKQSAVRFWVSEKTEPERIIGTVSLQGIRYDFFCSAILGYKFDREFWGRGYAGESVRKCLEIAFVEMNLHRIEACTLPENRPSRKLLERLGFAWEGTRRQSVKLHGCWRDHEVYALLAEEAKLLLGFL